MNTVSYCSRYLPLSAAAKLQQGAQYNYDVQGHPTEVVKAFTSVVGINGCAVLHVVMIRNVSLSLSLSPPSTLFLHNYNMYIISCAHNHTHARTTLDPTITHTHARTHAHTPVSKLWTKDMPPKTHARTHAQPLTHTHTHARTHTSVKAVDQWHATTNTHMHARTTTHTHTHTRTPSHQCQSRGPMACLQTYS